MSDKSKERYKYAALNRKANHEYEILDRFEAGIMLHGSEVKSLRKGSANIADAFAIAKDDGIYLMNAHISEYKMANRMNHEPLRPRKLLLHRKQINKLIGQTKTKGITVVPLSVYFNARGIAKVEIGICRGKKQYEKRESIKERDWSREKERMMKDRG